MTKKRNKRREKRRPTGVIPLRRAPRSRTPKAIDLSLSWFVLTVRVAWEARVALELLANGIAVYLPTEIRLQHASRGRVREVERPAFPRYVFVGLPPGPQISLASAFSRVTAIEGADRFLGPPEAPRALGAPAILAEIEGCLCEGGDVRIVKRRKRGHMDDLRAMIDEREAESLRSAA